MFKFLRRLFHYEPVIQAFGCSFAGSYSLEVRGVEPKAWILAGQAFMHDSNRIDVLHNVRADRHGRCTLSLIEPLKASIHHNGVLTPLDERASPYAA